MSESSTSARPRQVTMAAGLAIAGSAFLLLSIFETLGRLGSVETREGVSETLASGGAERMGVTVDQALGLMRGGLSLAAVCAAITLVAGGFVLTKHQGARIALSIATVPIFLTSLFTGTLLSVLVLASAMLLWSGPARDWFAGRPVRELPTRASRDSAARSEGKAGSSGASRPDPFATPPRTDPPRTDQPPTGQHPAPDPVPAVSARPSTTTQPAPSQGYGDPTSQQASPQASPPDPTAPGGPWSSNPAPEPTGGPQASDRRPPSQVRVAAVLTWIGSGLLLVAGLPLLVIASYAQLDELGAEVASVMGDTGQPVTRGMLQASVWLLVVILAVWALAAVLLAWLTVKGRAWARVLLLISAGVTAVAGLLAFPLGLVVQVPAIIAFVMLLRPESRQWFGSGVQDSSRAPAPPRRQDPPGRSGPW